MKDYIEIIKEKFLQILSEKNLLEDKVYIEARVLTPQEAIGVPERRDFPLLAGKERLIEAKFRNSYAAVFTDMPGNYEGKLKDILNMELRNNFERAIFISALNAVMRELKMIEGTRHCKDDEPEKCAEKLALWLKENYPEVKKVCLIGYQPAFVERISNEFDLTVLDLNNENFGRRFNAVVLDGKKFCEKVLKSVEIVICTGTVFVNNTIEEITKIKPIEEIIFYGVTVAGIAKLLNLKRVCFYSK